MELKEKKLEELKKIAKKNKLVGYSKLKKSDLIKFIKKFVHKSKGIKKSKKMIGGLYVYPRNIINPNVYIAIEPISEVLPPNTFTIYTTGISYEKLRYIWSLILAPKLKSIIPEERPIRIIHSELCDLNASLNNHNKQSSIHSFRDLERYLTRMDTHIFGNRLYSVRVTANALNFNAIEESGLENHFILDFAHLFKYSINTPYTVYYRLSHNESDIPNTFSGNSLYRKNVYQGLINEEYIQSLISDIANEQTENMVTIITEKNKLVSELRTHGYNEAANHINRIINIYRLNTITFGFVTANNLAKDVLDYENIFTYEEGRIKTYIHKAISERKIFITNDPSVMLTSFNDNGRIIPNISTYYNYDKIINEKYHNIIDHIRSSSSITPEDYNFFYPEHIRRTQIIKRKLRNNNNNNNIQDKRRLRIL